MTVAIPFLDASGALKERPVDAARFRRRARKVLLKEAAIMYEARRRVGTHAALTRAEVSGTTKKMYRQKGTGRARHGAAKVQLMRGGGVTFAKKPRRYGWSMPVKARRAALEGALRGKLDDGEVRVVARFDVKKPRTKDVAELLRKLELQGSFLLVPAEHHDALWRSCRNLPGSGYRVVKDLNAYEVLRYKWLVLDEAALEELEKRFGDA